MFTQQGFILYASESVTSLLGHLPVSEIPLMCGWGWGGGSENKTIFGVYGNFFGSVLNLTWGGWGWGVTCQTRYLYSQQRGIIVFMPSKLRRHNCFGLGCSLVIRH